MTFFSVIIPTFNSARTIGVALESVVQQTFTDLEVIVMDADSRDSTKDIIESYTDSRIKVYSEPDKGVYDAMNKGIKMASGVWVYFLGSDDCLYDEEVLNDVANLIKSSSCDVLYGNVISTRFGGEYGSAFNADDISRRNICHQAIFFQKHVFNKTGKFNLQYKTQADWDHNMRWFFSKKIKHIFLNRIIAKYSDGGLSAGGDALFEQHRSLNYIIYAGKNVPLKRRLQVLKYEFNKAVEKKNTRLVLKILVSGFKTITKL